MKDAEHPPVELLRIAESVDEEPQRCSYRQLLAYFGETAPGVLLRRRIVSTIQSLGLVVSPSLEGLSLDATVAFTRAAGVAKKKVAPAAPAVQRAPRPQELSVSLARSLRRRHATLLVGDVPGALERAKTIPAGTNWLEARTHLDLQHRPGLVVLSGSRSIRGVVTWRGLARSASPENGPVRLEQAQAVAHDMRLLDALPLFEAHQVLVVLDSERLPCGPLDASAALSLLRVEAEPYLLIDEIEHLLRGLLDGSMRPEEMASARAPQDSRRAVTRAADLSFGEYERLLQQPALWPRFKLEGKLDQGVFTEKLREVRELRNRVMHFDREHRTEGDRRLLLEMVTFLREYLGG